MYLKPVLNLKYIFDTVSSFPFNNTKKQTSFQFTLLRILKNAQKEQKVLVHLYKIQITNSI